jgi:myo-inositol-1(or 4)-monophosphatase
VSSGDDRSGAAKARDALADHLLDACVRAARRGGAYIRARTEDIERLDWRVKARADFVSDVDTGAEQRIGEALLSAVPEARVLGEELSPGVGTTDGIAFVVDPLDGTTNFLHRYPWYAVSIAAMVDGTLVAGAVLHVPNDTMFTASLGGGSFRDERPIRVSSLAEPDRALIGTGFPFKNPEVLDTYQPQFARIARATAGIRRAGAAALDLCDVAQGAFEGFWELILAPWDMAAGILIIREAGGRVTDLAGVDARPSHSPLVASNGLLHQWLLAQLRDPPPGSATD